MLPICCWLLLTVSLTQADKVLRINFNSTSQAAEFKRYTEEKNLDVWSLRPSSADVAVSSAAEEGIQKLFRTTVLVESIEGAVNEEKEENEAVKRVLRRFRTFQAPIYYFARYNEIVSYLSRLASSHSFVTMRSIGKSFEGRDTMLVRIGNGRETKPAVFVMGGIHAREWLASASTLYLIDKLVTGMLNGDKRITALLSKYDFYIAPVTNPDGYEYSHISPRTRSWRKTRSPQNYGCIGADPNRNFDVDFGQKSASQNPCNIIYPGPYAFSEPCTQNLRDFALSPVMKNRIKLFYDVHAYSQMYFVPYAFNSRQKPKNDQELRRVARISNNALQRVNGRHFILGTPGQILYEASGSTMDWFMLSAGVPYSYAFEVFPDMRSRIGFLARPSDIQPSGEEISEAIFTAAENINV